MNNEDLHEDRTENIINDPTAVGDSPAAEEPVPAAPAAVDSPAAEEPVPAAPAAVVTTYHPRSAHKVAKVRPSLQKADWLLLGAALMLALLFGFCFDQTRFRIWAWGMYLFPSLGFCLFLLGGLMTALARRGALNRSAWQQLSCQQKLLIGAYVGLALSFFLCGDQVLLWLDVPVALLLVPWTLFALGTDGEVLHLPQAVRSFGALFPALFDRFGLPVRSLFSGERGRDGAEKAARRRLLLSVLAGLLIALPLLAIAISLLAAADQVFGDVFGHLGDWLNRISLGHAFWVIVRTLVVGLAGFSLLFNVQQGNAVKAAADKLPSLPRLTWLIIFVLLDAVYLLFAVIQFAFLFAGAESTAMSAGYAQYAREGFFQLVWVGIINLALLWLARREAVGSRGLRLACTLMLACTGVILASAAWRMTLYVRAFGLTILRLTTLWGLVMMAIVLIFCAINLWQPQKKTAPLLFALLMCGWLLLNWGGADRIIASYNVDHYLSGQLEELDIDYLNEALSPAATPALERLIAAGPSYEARRANQVLERIDFDRDNLSFLDVSLPWVIYR